MAIIYVKEEFIDEVALRILPTIVARYDQTTVRTYASEMAYAVAGDMWEARQKFFNTNKEPEDNRQDFNKQLMDAHSRDPSLRGERR